MQLWEKMHLKIKIKKIIIIKNKKIKKFLKTCDLLCCCAHQHACGQSKGINCISSFEVDSQDTDDIAKELEQH